MTGHMSAFTNFILSFFRITLSFQTLSSSFTGHSYSCIDVFWAAARVCLGGSNILERVYLGYRFPTNANRYICNFVSYYHPGFFRAFNFSSLILLASFTLCTMLFISWRFTTQSCVICVPYIWDWPSSNNCAWFYYLGLAHYLPRRWVDIFRFRFRFRFSLFSPWAKINTYMCIHK